MEGFVQDYLRTAAADPRAGYDLLTPAFQEESGRLGGYTRFWAKVATIDAVRDVVADPDALLVSYTYSYTATDGRRTTDDVRLQLTYQDGTYRIAGEG
ncbi:unannotated protein [freshwater metagenome]|uniref:Unannotated protein n=1 Tax=freshwater metagenome TaxID=449393 RepID=A0A6J6RDH8_9ZZZZ